MSALDSPPLAGRRHYVPALVVQEEPDTRTSSGGCAGACETNLPAATADSCVDQTQPFLSGKKLLKNLKKLHVVKLRLQWGALLCLGLRPPTFLSC